MLSATGELLPEDAVTEKAETGEAEVTLSGMETLLTEDPVTGT